jgi:hypothetical protein
MCSVIKKEHQASTSAAAAAVLKNGKLIQLIETVMCKIHSGA